MAKKLCDLCQQTHAADMRFGVALCQDCIDGYSKAISGDVEALSRFSNPENFPNSTELAQKNIIFHLANRVKQIEEKKQKQQYEEQRQSEENKQEHKRESYAQSIGVTYEKKSKHNAESFIDGLYIDIGNKIKRWARWIFIVEAIACIIGSIVLMVEGSFVVALITLFCGPVVAWVSSWILYAFGELVDKTVQNEKNTRNISRLMLENNIDNIKE